MQKYIPAKFGAWLVVLTVLGSAPLVHATTINFANNTATYNNVGGITGLTLTVGCVTTGTACTVDYTQIGITTNYELGVNTTGTGDPTQIDGANNEYLTFTFSGTGAASARLTGLLLTGTTTGYVYNQTTATYILGSAADIALTTTPAFTTNNTGTVFRVGTNTNNTGFFVQTLSFTDTPEPATYGMMGLGLAGIGFVRFRRRKS